MACVLILKGTGMSVTVFSPRDILDYVQMYMGNDATTYIADLINELEEENREIDERMNSDLTSYESSLDSNRDAFQEILRTVESIEKELAKSRCDKQKIRKLLDQIDTEINNQI